MVSAAISTSAFASQLVCDSGRNRMGASQSITIVEKDGQYTVSGGAQGGVAQFVTGFGPFAATETISGDMVTYTFTDEFNQTGKVTVVTSIFDGKFSQTATSDYGLWQDSVLDCK
jgi:hypothetical protein